MPTVVTLARFAAGEATADQDGSVVVALIGNDCYRVFVKAGCLPDGSDHEDFDDWRDAIEFALETVTMVNEEIAW